MGQYDIADSYLVEISERDAANLGLAVRRPHGRRRRTHNFNSSLKHPLLSVSWIYSASRGTGPAELTASPAASAEAGFRRRPVSLYSTT